MANRFGFSTAALITNLNCGPVAGVRPVLGQLPSGRWGETSAPAVSWNPCAVHPAPKGDTLDPELADSDRNKDRVRVYTVSAIIKGDRITWPHNGEDRQWRVVTVMPYEEQAGAWIAEAALIDKSAA
jgi:hypothetical protein